MDRMRWFVIIMILLFCYRKNRRSVAPSVTGGAAEQGPAFSVSMRHAFVPFSGEYDDVWGMTFSVYNFASDCCVSLVSLHCAAGGMILAADYSQLELRVLAHLSKDQRLLQVGGLCITINGKKTLYTQT